MNIYTILAILATVFLVACSGGYDMVVEEVVTQEPPQDSEQSEEEVFVEDEDFVTEDEADIGEVI